MCDYCSWIEQILARINAESKLLQERIPPSPVNPTVIVHGGAGRISKTKRTFMIEEVKSAALEAYKTLIHGYTAVDAVEIAISRMENTMHSNYMEEASIHTNGEIIMDAAIMTNNLDAGCVGVVCGIEHPIKLAREVLENTSHVLIVENGAQRLAEKAKLSKLSQKYLIQQSASTDDISCVDEMISEEEHCDLTNSIDSIDKSNNENEANKSDDIRCKENEISTIKMYFPQCSFLETEGNEELGELDKIVPFHEDKTVGAVAYDRKKRLSSGISTMREPRKVMGSVNAIDTIIGCGIYADENGCCSISGNSKTIYGYAPARKIVRRFNSKTTMMLEINEELEKFEIETGESRIGVIALNDKGEPSVSFKSLHFPWACCRNGYLYYGCKESDKFCEKITNLSRSLDCMCERSK